MLQRVLFRYQYVLFFLLSLAPFFWNIGIGTYPFFGGGDFSTPIDVSYELRKYVFTFEPNISGGYENTAYLSLFFPYYLSIVLCSYLHITPFIGVLLYISLLLFLSMCAMFHYLQFVLSEQFRIKTSALKFWSILGACLYGFSPYPIGLMPPGHFHSLVLFAVFPLILLYYTRFLEEENVSVKILLILFFLFVGCTGGASYSISMIYVLSIIFTAYTFLFAFFKHRRIIHIICRLGLILMLILLANSWWLVPFSVNLNFSLSEFNMNSLNNLVSIATQKATIVNLFLGRGEAQLYLIPSFANYFGWPATLVFFLMILSTGYTLIFKRKYSYVLICFGMLLLGAFITKGPQKPFGEVFQFFYDHIPGFQIFRRPVNKFYWEFLFFFITLSMIGSALFEKRFMRFRYSIRLIGGTVFGGGAVWFVYSFVVASGLVPFQIPRYYYEARDFLMKEHAARVLLLPGVFGGYPYFGSAVHTYYGWDFIHETWKVSVISPDPTSYSPDLPNKKIINTMMNRIRNSQSICDQAKNLGISHIAVRRDLLSGTVEDTPDVLIKSLDQSGDIRSKYVFGENDAGLVIYSMKSACTRDLVFLDIEENKGIFTYKLENPVRIAIRISGIAKPHTITLLQNFSPWWKLYPVPLYNQNGKTNLLEAKPLLDVYHNKSNGYANSWFIDPYYIKKTYNDNYYEILPDGSITLLCILYFQLQTYYYAGISITVFTCVVLLLLLISKGKTKKRNI